MFTRLMLVLVGLVLSAGASGAPLYGDANGDGAVSLSDVRLLLCVTGGLEEIADTVRRNGDVAPVNDYDAGSFGDGRVTLLDAIRLIRRLAGLSTDAWPAKTTGFLLENGNGFVTRQYDSAGIAITGPGTGEPDVSTVFTGPMTEVVGSTTYTNVFRAISSDGDEQHLLPIFDANRNPAGILATVLTLGNHPARFDPPLLAVKFPMENGVSWSGASTATDLETGTTLSATYNGKIEGPATVTMADGLHTFDNAYKVTLSYNAGALLYGAEYYWFVPFVGPVQHGFTRTALFETTSVVPDYRLTSANVHGVLYP